MSFNPNVPVNVTNVDGDLLCIAPGNTHTNRRLEQCILLLSSAELGAL